MNRCWCSLGETPSLFFRESISISVITGRYVQDKSFGDASFPDGKFDFSYISLYSFYVSI